MFEQLDDPAEFEVSESFFAGTSRKFAARRRRHAAMRTGGGVLCLALVTPAFVSVFQSHRAGDSAQPDTSAADESTTAVNPVDDTQPSDSTPADTAPVAPGEAENFLIVGGDNNACSEPGSPYAGGLAPPRTGERSDTIMVVRLDPANGTASVLSFPRDLWVDIPGRGTGRINSAYRQDDPQLLIDTLRAEFDLPIDHFIQIDFCAFKKVIDGIGGVTLALPFAVRDQNTGLDIATAGCTSLDGDEALAYVRSRHLEYQDTATGAWHEDPSADLGRIARQQDLLRRVLASASSAGLLNANSITSLYSAYRDDLVVDVGLTIAKMIELVDTISTIDPANMRSYQIEATGEIIAGSAVLIWHKDSATMQSILDIFRGVAPTTNSTSTPDAVPTPAPNTPASAIVPDPSSQC